MSFFFFLFFEKKYYAKRSEQIFNAQAMSSLNIKTFKSGSIGADFQLFFLSKGLNSGKPLEVPCPNCFVLLCESNDELKFYKTVAQVLWKKQVFILFLTGSVVPFIRINDFKKVFSEGISQANRNHRFRELITQLQAFDELEKTYLKSLSLIQEAKKAIYFDMFQT